MTNKKLQGKVPQKLNATTLHNLAVQSDSIPPIRLQDPAVDTVLKLLTQLSPANAHLVENLIRGILAEQENKTP